MGEGEENDITDMLHSLQEAACLHDQGPQEQRWRLSAILALRDSPVVGQVMPRIYRIADIKAGLVFRKQFTSRSILVHTGRAAFLQGSFCRGSDPLLPFKVRHRAGMTIAQQIVHFSSPFRGGRSLHSDPCGEAVESARKPTAEKQQTTNGPQAETGKPGGCTQPNISDPRHGQLATPLDGLGLRVDTRLTCPPTSWRVQWIPFQKEGYNEGTAAG